MGIVGQVLRKEGKPMGKFLVNVLAAIVAGVIVALIIRCFNV
jgi:fluoride ion exporter CrcB/FEX